MILFYFSFDLIQQFLNGSEEARQAIEDETNKLARIAIENKKPLNEIDTIFNEYSDTIGGNIIEDNNGVMSDVYYPNSEDTDYTASVLSNIQ